MKKAVSISFAIALGLTLVTGCSKKAGVTSTPVTPTPTDTTNAAIGKAPPATWQEHWFDHVQLINLRYYDTSVAVYYDNDVSTTIKWPNNYLGKAWNYTKKIYGNFGNDSRLFAIFHTGKYGGGHPSTYMDASHDFRNVIDCGSGNLNAWVSGAGNDIDLTTHEIGHIVEGASKGVHGSPAFDIWGDSKWMEIYQYDVYLGLNRTDDAVRWYNEKMTTTDDFPRAGTQWFKNWFYPTYMQYGKTALLNNFFTNLSKYFPKKTFNNGITTYPEYSRGMNFGEFVHFWSGAAGTDLKALALTAFGSRDKQGNDWTIQLAQAKLDFPAMVY